VRTFFYVYILASDSNEETHYTGVTRDLEQRLLEHNQGKCPNIARHGHGESKLPWRSDRKQKPVRLRNI
jgi:predicted GIY-YIG superfamily endonuclease